MQVQKKGDRYHNIKKVKYNYFVFAEISVRRDRYRIHKRDENGE